MTKKIYDLLTVGKWMPTLKKVDYQEFLLGLKFWKQKENFFIEGLS